MINTEQGPLPIVRCGDCGQRLDRVGAECGRCDAVCANCRQLLRLHVTINGVYNGVQLLCPSSTFYPAPNPVREAAKLLQAALDNYFSYSPSRRDEKALGPVETARRVLVEALEK